MKSNIFFKSISSRTHLTTQGNDSPSHLSNAHRYNTIKSHRSKDMKSDVIVGDDKSEIISRKMDDRKDYNNSIKNIREKARNMYGYIITLGFSRR